MHAIGRWTKDTLDAACTTEWSDELQDDIEFSLQNAEFVGQLEQSTRVMWQTNE